jgi:hypothetical protein
MVASWISAAADIHGIFDLHTAGVAFWMDALRPIVLLNITATELGNMLGEPDSKHLRVLGHRVPEAVPPY